LIVELPSDLAVEVIDELNPRNSGRIFDRMSPVDAARLSALLLGSQEVSP